MIFNCKRFSELLSEFGTQKDFSEHSDIGENDISHYKNGNRQPTTRKLMQLADGLDVDVKELIIHTPLDLYAYREYEVLHELLEEIALEEDPDRLDLLLSKYQVIAKAHDGLYGKMDLGWDRKSHNVEDDEDEDEWEL